MERRTAIPLHIRKLPWTSKAWLGGVQTSTRTRVTSGGTVCVWAVRREAKSEFMLDRSSPSLPLPTLQTPAPEYARVPACGACECIVVQRRAGGLLYDGSQGAPVSLAPY